MTTHSLSPHRWIRLAAFLTCALATHLTNTQAQENIYCETFDNWLVAEAGVEDAENDRLIFYHIFQPFSDLVRLEAILDDNLQEIVLRESTFDYEIHNGIFPFTTTEMGYALGINLLGHLHKTGVSIAIPGYDFSRPGKITLDYMYYSFDNQTDTLTFRCSSDQAYFDYELTVHQSFSPFKSLEFEIPELMSNTGFDTITIRIIKEDEDRNTHEFVLDNLCVQQGIVSSTLAPLPGVIRVYPTVVSSSVENVRLVLPSASSGSLRVFHMDGRLVWQGSIAPAGDDVRIPVSNLSNGTYQLLFLDDSNRFFVGRLIKI